MTATTSSCSCDEYAATSVGRRGLLRGAALLGAVSTFGTTVVTTSQGTAWGAPASSVIVVLSMRGAADGLSLVVPHGDPTYYAARPRIAVPAASLLAKDAMFGLHPALAPLVPLWNAGKLAAVHATGLPVANRSHFAAMEEVEDADPGSSARVGWLNRLLGADALTSPVQGLAVGSAAAPASFVGTQPVMTMPDLATVTVAGGDPANPQDARLRSLRTMWGSSATAMGSGVRTSLAGSAALKQATAQPDRSASYPATGLGQALSAVARTLRADIGVSLVTVDQGDWDMHTDQGTATSGRLVTNATDFAKAVAAFSADLGPVADKVTLVTISEFGRRVAENANAGTDHGWGNVMFVAGAGVKGGRYLGTWPGLQNTLDADLAVTTDYRSVLAEVVASRTTASTAAVFPGFRRERVGVMQGQ
ncbi:DUF1501 domain-containing protein [Nocardioides abyssi]|uniref:DUF1501 domain-containing protein n=1 Tax=Nocardioides abyssi TaxID=3058370 RepID=A0ABT8EPG0_9ACTN|nr:DUF1501 domain-containing protein [Nocardioides abyssi]MDN4160014.1 DUF1501 domain-containing protein [Nocardioides abyssi]